MGVSGVDGSVVVGVVAGGVVVGAVSGGGGRAGPSVGGCPLSSTIFVMVHGTGPTGAYHNDVVCMIDDVVSAR